MKKDTRSLLCLMIIVLSYMSSQHANAQYYNPYHNHSAYGSAWQYGYNTAIQEQERAAEAKRQAWQYGYNMAIQEQERAAEAKRLKQLARTKYQRMAQWPKNATSYTSEVRYYLIQAVNVGKGNGSVTAMPGQAESGITIRYKGNTPIAYAYINQDGHYVSKYWQYIGRTTDEKTNQGIWVGGDEKTGDLFFKILPDNRTINILQESDLFNHCFIYSISKGDRQNCNEVISTPGINLNETHIEVAQPNSKRSRRTCTSCNGSGKGMSSKYYAPEYTGQNSDYYCDECKSWGSIHTHLQSSCKVCNGKGYID